MFALLKYLKLFYVKISLNPNHSIILILNMHQKQQRNINRSTDTIASFLLKTYQILQHPEYERMISWDKNNVGFIIHDVLSFTRQILPKYFRHSNFSSFVRQLNMYDFHKVKQQNQSLVFKNPLFCKGQQHNLKFIRRKAAKKIGNHRRQASNEKNDVQNEKYQNLLKSFKKSIEFQINQSCLFYERSIQLVKDSKASNENKLRNIQSVNKFIENAKLSHLNSNDSEQENKSISSGQTLCQSLNNDALLILREQSYKSYQAIDHWLNDYIQIQKKKLKYVSSFNSQLSKCLQKKVMDPSRLNSQNNNQSYEENSDSIQNNAEIQRTSKFQSCSQLKVQLTQKKEKPSQQKNETIIIPKRLGFSALSPSFGNSNNNQSLFSQFLSQSPFGSFKKQNNQIDRQNQKISLSDSNSSLQQTLNNNNNNKSSEKIQAQNGNIKKQQ